MMNEIQVQSLPEDWAVFDELSAAHVGVVEECYAAFDQLIVEWDRLLAEFGEDPTHVDWERFRPLRLSREEDWSDWLAFLLERSQTGVLAHALFGDGDASKEDFATPRFVDREVIHREYRADVVAGWSDGSHTHVEVKVGDVHLDKTFATSRAMRSRYRQTEDNWENYILMLSAQVPDWNEVDRAEPGEPPVRVLTWADVCIALRRALLSEENQAWKAWAFSFVGSIEQLLVGFPGHKLSARPTEKLETKTRILREGLDRG